MINKAPVYIPDASYWKCSRCLAYNDYPDVYRTEVGDRRVCYKCSAIFLITEHWVTHSIEIVEHIVDNDT